MWTRCWRQSDGDQVDNPYRLWEKLKEFDRDHELEREQKALKAQKEVFARARDGAEIIRLSAAAPFRLRYWVIDEGMLNVCDHVTAETRYSCLLA